LLQALHPLVGRDREVQELHAALDSARAGQGGLWLIEGEAGIGKSRLVEEIGRTAAASGLPVLWGRCWEAGGAPAFWPWSQILRALARRADAVSRAGLERHTRQLSQILPDLGGHAAPRIDEEVARFQLLEAISAALCDAAVATPLVVVLEDLHAADPSSVAVLEMLAAQARSASLLGLGTYREADARRARVAAALGRVARSAHKQNLSPLGPTDVERYLEAALGRDASRSLVEAVQRVSEGNPLFVVELTRWLQAHGEEPDADRVLAVPRSLRALVDERLDVLSPSCREVLAAASVLGRDFAMDGLHGLGDWSASVIGSALAEATEAAVLVEVSVPEYSSAIAATAGGCTILAREPPASRRAQGSDALGWVAAELTEELEADLLLVTGTLE